MPLLTDTLFAWQSQEPYRGRRNRTLPFHTTLHLLSDPVLIKSLPLETPIFSSREEALQHLRDSHPAPDLNLTYIYLATYGDSAYVFDLPLYCGIDSPLTLKALTFRFPSIWVPTSFANSGDLPFPLHVTTRQCLDNKYTLVTNSPSVIARVRTRRSNIAARQASLLSGGPILPLSLFDPLRSFLSAHDSYYCRSRTLRLTKTEYVDDFRPDLLSSLCNYLLTIPDPSHHYPRRPDSRHLRDQRRTLSLLLHLIPFIPHLPSLTSFPSSSPYDSLRRWLNNSTSPYWQSPSKSPLFEEGLTYKDKPLYEHATTTNGSLLAALISREIRIGLRLHHLTLSKARSLPLPR